MWVFHVFDEAKCRIASDPLLEREAQAPVSVKGHVALARNYAAEDQLEADRARLVARESYLSTRLAA